MFVHNNSHNGRRSWFSLSGLEKNLSRNAAVLIILTIIGVIAYSNTFNSPFELDDYGSILNNYAIRNPLDFSAIWGFYSSRFVSYLSFALNNYLHGDSVVGYHVTNLAIHIINGFLVFLILKSILMLHRFENRSISKYRNLVCLLAAAIFIVHPVNTGAVTYIVQRIASLSAMFMLLSVYSYLKYRVTDKIELFVATILFAFIAMFTKENSIILPLLLIFIEFLLFMKEYKIGFIKRSAIIFILLLTMATIPVTNIYLGGHSQSDPDKSFKASTTMDRTYYMTTEINVVGRYCQLMFLPNRQNFDYENQFPKSKTIFANNSIFSLTFIFLALLAAIFTFRRNKLISLGIIWFFLGLSVESTFISIKDVYFEHRLYFPSAGYAILIAGLCFSTIKIFNRKISPDKPIALFLATCLFIIPLYTALTLKRNYLFTSEILLWQDVLKSAPNSDRARTSLGTGYLNHHGDPGIDREKYLEMAETQYRIALVLNPKNSAANSNLANVYYLQGRYQKSMEQAQKALKVQATTYNYHNLGAAYEKLGNDALALQAYLDGYKLDFKNIFIIADLGNILFKLKDYEAAKNYYDSYNSLKGKTSNTTVEQNLKYIESLRK